MRATKNRRNFQFQDMKTLTKLQQCKVIKCPSPPSSQENNYFGCKHPLPIQLFDVILLKRNGNKYVCRQISDQNVLSPVYSCSLSAHIQTFFIPLTSPPPPPCTLSPSRQKLSQLYIYFLPKLLIKLCKLGLMTSILGFSRILD